MKKGFTLVELLAVIAILAILIIIALPNVLEMFNNAKKDVFVTEVKTVSSSAEKRYLTSQMSGDAETTFCRSETDSINPLNMSGAEKYYYIALNSKGRIRYLVVWDDGRYIKYKYSSSRSVTSLDKKDIVENDNEAITCANVIDELDVASPTPIEDMELVATATQPNGIYTLVVNVRLLDSEDLEELSYRIYRKPDSEDDSAYELISQVNRSNNDDEFSYSYEDDLEDDEVLHICGYPQPVYRVEVWSEGVMIKEIIAHNDWNC
jgi:prepilin-type N-terminal cleavage/methylation domain-containing protein